jgi:hypothetical protein
VDMRRHLKSWLNDTELARLGDTFEGVIENVTEQEVRNRYTAARELHPIIKFDDGHVCIPNIGMRQALIGLFGPETDDWRGRRVQIFRRQVERTDKTTGVVKARWIKTINCVDSAFYDAGVAFPRRSRPNGVVLHAPAAPPDDFPSTASDEPE